MIWNNIIKGVGVYNSQTQTVLAPNFGWWGNRMWVTAWHPESHGLVEIWDKGIG